MLKLLDSDQMNIILLCFLFCYWQFFLLFSERILHFIKFRFIHFFFFIQGSFCCFKLVHLWWFLSLQWSQLSHYFLISLPEWLIFISHFLQLYLSFFLLHYKLIIWKSVLFSHFYHFHLCFHLYCCHSLLKLIFSIWWSLP